ncbi:MAG: putative lipoprotein [Psychromonas sp.]|jgi:putative lipoprotein|uniref:hypothetical protein n=1 Tax=Psychromonas sp. TaxID=1884585 RepID=UPI0039E49A0B
MRLSHWLLSVPLFFTAACSTTPPAPAEKKAEPVIIKQDFSKILESNFRGQLSLGDGEAYFKICGTDQEFAVDAKAALRNIYEQITSTKLIPVYIEFSGEIVFPTPTDKKHDALMRIDRIHHMALAKTSLQCEKLVNTFQFKARGDEPYWRLNITDQKLFFATKARNQVYQVNDANFQTTQINHVKSTNKEGQRLNVMIQPGHCYDLKNKEYWGYTAKVDSVWGEFTGCGEPGWPIIEHTYSGYYLHNSPSKTENLTLNENYTVEYKEKTGDKTTLKTGFWKSNSPDRVVVMLTKQEGKTIREELVFDSLGLMLNARSINKNNIVTHFEAAGLPFNKMNAKETAITIDRIDREFAAQNISPDAEVDLEVQKAVNQYFQIHRTDPRDTQFNSVKYDLNGDGVKDALVLLDWCSQNGCEMLVFEGTENGYRFSSRVSRVNAPIIVAQTQHYLWQSLLIEKNGQWFKLDFDGISYPIHSRDLKEVNKEDEATPVVLFSQGIPEKWFPIKS